MISDSCKRYKLITLIFLLANFSFFSQLGNQSCEYSSSIYSDNKGLGIDEIQSQKFVKSDSSNFSFGMSAGWHWIKLEIQNSSAQDRSDYLVIKTSMINNLFGFK
jgi:hypothetical protein